MSEENYKIKVLTRDNLSELLPLYHATQGEDKTPTQHFVVICDEQGEIIGYFGMESCVFLGPFYIEPSHRGTDATELLALATFKRVSATFKDEPSGGLAVVLTDNRHVEHLLSRLGFEPYTGQAYMERVGLRDDAQQG